MLKIKHQRTADCVVAGFRWHKNGPGTHVGSLLLGLFDDEGTLHHVGITSSFTWDRRAALATELAPLRDGALEGHPWGEWAEWAQAGAADASGQRLPGATSRWNRGKDLSWEPLRAERVVEVAYDHLQGDRFRHGTTFLRWRPDKPPERLPLRPARGVTRRTRARADLRRLTRQRARTPRVPSSSAASVPPSGRPSPPASAAAPGCWPRPAPLQPGAVAVPIIASPASPNLRADAEFTDACPLALLALDHPASTDRANSRPVRYRQGDSVVEGRLARWLLRAAQPAPGVVAPDGAVAAREGCRHG